jgi:hypothetical protein
VVSSKKKKKKKKNLDMMENKRGEGCAEKVIQAHESSTDANKKR